MKKQKNHYDILCKMLSTHIEKLLKNDKTFMGCYPKDKLPKKFPKVLPKTIVVNTGLSSTHGDHWVALRLLKTSCLYFDSFGVEIVDKEILSFIKRKYLKYTFNNKCIQYYDSKNCGKFCVAFIKMVKNRNNFKSFVNKFDFHNLKNNDKQIVKILKKFNID